MEPIAQTTFRKRKSYLGVWLCAFLLVFMIGAVTFSLLAHLFNDPNTLLRNARRLTPIHPENGETYVWKSSHQAVILVSRAANPSNSTMPIRLYDMRSHQTILLPQNDVLLDFGLTEAIARTAMQAADEQAHLVLYQSIGKWLPNNVQARWNMGGVRYNHTCLFLSNSQGPYATWYHNHRLCHGYFPTQCLSHNTAHTASAFSCVAQADDSETAYSPEDSCRSVDG